jgi:hypothetical protein
MKIFHSDVTAYQFVYNISAAALDIRCGPKDLPAVFESHLLSVKDSATVAHPTAFRATAES